MIQAWMFPGQGSQTPGMADRLLAEFPQAREILDEASELSGSDLNKLRQRGPAHLLASPAVAEPLLAATQIAFAEVLLEAGVQPQMVAGYSAGEVAAFYTAGILSRSDALRVATIRGSVLECYATAATRMVNVSRIAVETIEDVLQELSEIHTKIEVACFNAPDSLTLVGSVADVRVAAIELQALGGVVSDVPVAGPWHSSFVAGARQEIHQRLSGIVFQPPQRLVFLSATGKLEVEPARLASALAAQVTMPVKWQDIVEHFWLFGIRDVLEVGSGRVLLGLLRRNWTDFSAYTVECVESSGGSIAPLKRVLAASYLGHSS